MPINHLVQQGDCISSIAARYGFMPDTIWSHDANAKLRSSRKDGNVLLPGDVVVVPDKVIKKVSRPTDAVHRFCLMGTTTNLRLQLLAEDSPRGDLGFVLKVDGTKVKEGRTDGQGWIDCRISAGASGGELVLEDGTTVELNMGNLDPIDTVTGLQGRLLNLGFDCGSVDGDAGPLTRSAVREFQRSRGLPETGDADATTLTKLADFHQDLT